MGTKAVHAPCGAFASLPSIVASVVMAIGCATAPGAAPPAPPPKPIAGLERYMPALDGYVYEYDVETDMGETGRMVVQVARPRPDMAELNVAGKVQRLEMSKDAVRHATGGYLLKAPLQAGAEWKGQFGTVRVSSVTRSIQVPAGSYDDCIETIEESVTPTAKRATSVFCPDVGMVSLHIEGALDGEAASVGTKLRFFGPRATGLE